MAKAKKKKAWDAAELRALLKEAESMVGKEHGICSKEEMLRMAGALKEAGKLDEPVFGSNTALTLACVNGDADAIDGIIALGADVNAPTLHGQSPMMQVLHGVHVEMKGRFAANQALECMEALLAAGADIRHGNQLGQQAIHWAGWQIEALELAGWLLSHGADPSAACDDGTTPLHDAARRGSLEAVKLFAGAGADLFAKATDPENKKAALDPLNLATRWLPMTRAYDVVVFLADAQLAAMERKELEAHVPEAPRAKPGPRV